MWRLNATDARSYIKLLIFSVYLYSRYKDGDEFDEIDVKTKDSSASYIFKSFFARILA